MEFHRMTTVFLLVLLACISTVTSLECYACERQDSNRDKCIKTTKQCEEHQDICTIDLHWGLPPYWIPYGDRAIYVWKGCDTLKNCQNRKQVTMPLCKRDWYGDWKCTECCSGDLCNYYVTLAGQRSAVSLACLASCLTLLAWLLH